MRFWKTWAVLAVAVALGAYIRFVESKKPETPEKKKEKAVVFDKAKVRELTLTPATGEAIRLARDGSAWKMTAPQSVPADPSEIDSLLSSLENLEVDEIVVDSAPRPADFGLDPPKLTLGILLEGATEPLKVLVGEKTPDGGALYARLPTQPRVFTVASYVENTFGKKPFDLRDRSVLHVKRDAVKTLAISGPEGGYTLARDDKGEWVFSQPVATPAGRWSVDGLLGTLESLRMDSVAAEEARDLKPFGLAKPARTVVLSLTGGATKTLEIGDPADEKAKEADASKTKGKDQEKDKDKDKGKGKGEGKDQGKPKEAPKPGKYYARDGSSRLVTVIPAALVDDLAKGMTNLRAKRLLEVATYEVQSFEVELEGTKRVYTRSSVKDKEGIDVFKWKRTVPDGRDLDTNKVQDVLFKLGGVEAQAFVDAPGPLEGYGLDKPVLKVTLRHEGSKPAAWFELSRKEGSFYVRRVGDAALLKLDPGKGDDVLKAFKEL